MPRYAIARVIDAVDALHAAMLYYDAAIVYYVMMLLMLDAALR